MPRGFLGRCFSRFAQEHSGVQRFLFDVSAGLKSCKRLEWELELGVPVPLPICS